MKNDILKIFLDSEILFSKKLLELRSNIMTTEFFISGLARLTRICNSSTDSETSLKVMRYWKFSQKTKLKQTFLPIVKKEVRNVFKTGIIY